MEAVEVVEVEKVENDVLTCVCACACACWRIVILLHLLAQRQEYRQQHS